MCCATVSSRLWRRKRRTSPRPPSPRNSSIRSKFLEEARRAMIPREVLRKVRHIEIRTRRLITDMFGGEYHSVFKGLGMEFAEVREYAAGDDIRSIDWNVTARMGHPFVKLYREERELTVVLLVD